MLITALDLVGTFAFAITGWQDQSAYKLFK